MLLNTFNRSFGESSTESFLWVQGQAGYTVRHCLLKDVLVIHLQPELHFKVDCNKKNFQITNLWASSVRETIIDFQITNKINGRYFFFYMLLI